MTEGGIDLSTAAAILDGAPDATIVIDHSGRIRYVSGPGDGLRNLRDAPDHAAACRDRPT